MSEENVELSLRLNGAWSRRDVEALIALWDPEGVWYPPFEGITEGRTYRGHAEMRQYFEDVAEFAEESHAEFTEVHDLGDQVLGLGHAWFRFASGIELDHEHATLFKWRNGKCVEVRSWHSHAEGLEAAGLGEYDLKAAIKNCKKKFPKGAKRKKCIKKAKARAA
jgi:ketosteroid isomerase-like protein